LRRLPSFPTRRSSDLGERPAGVEVVSDGGVIPIGEVGDEVEKRAAELNRIVEQCAIAARLLETRTAFSAEQVLTLMRGPGKHLLDRKSTRLNSSHSQI